MRPKWFIIINPTAGGGKGQKQWKNIKQLLEKMGIAFQFAMTRHQHHAIELAKKAVEDGFRFVAAVGGDGTAHEVINGLMQQQKIPTTELTFALIPMGTGNDWIRTHKIPNNYKKAILLMKAGQTLLHDIGLIHYYHENGAKGKRYFLNVAGLGYDAFVTRASNKQKGWSRSKLYYFYLIMASIAKYKSTDIRLSMDGEVIEGNFYSLAVGQCIYNGGGAQFVPHAIPNDGQFAITGFKDIAAWEIVMNSPKFYTGKIAKHHKAITRQLNSLEVEAIGEQPTLVEADGEFLGQTPVRFEMLPQALKVIIP